MVENNEKKSESIGDRLERELGRPVSLAECEKEAMRAERDEYKAENKRLAEIITAFLDCDKWLTCKKVGTVDCFEECGNEKTEYEEGKMPVILSRAFKVELTGLLEKYHGRTLDAAFCPYCNTFTLLSMAKGTAAECPVCLKNRQLAKITVEQPNAPAPRPESLCKTCKNAPRDIKCLFKEMEIVGDDTIRCAGYTKEDPAPKLADGECPACGGEYGKHNDTPANQGVDGPAGDTYIFKLVMKILSIPQRLWKPMRHNIRTKLLHIRNRLIKNGNVDGSVIETKEITLTCGWCGVKLVPGVYHTCLEKPWKIDFDNAVDVLFAKVLAEKFTSEEAMLGLKKKDVADVLDTIIKENRKRGVSDRFLELHGNDVVDYVYDKVRLARKQDKIRTTRSE